MLPVSASAPSSTPKWVYPLHTGQGKPIFYCKKAIATFAIDRAMEDIPKACGNAIGMVLK